MKARGADGWFTAHTTFNIDDQSQAETYDKSGDTNHDRRQTLTAKTPGLADRLGLEGRPMSSKPAPAFSDRIVSLKPRDKDSYRVVVDVGEGRSIAIICRVELKRLSSGKLIRVCNIPSQEYGLEVMRGNINSRAICKQIVDFHSKVVAEENLDG